MKEFINKLTIFNIIIIIAALILLVLLFISILLIIPFPLNYGLNDIIAIDNNVKYVDDSEEMPYLYIETNNGEISDENFNILTFTDTHIDGSLKNRNKNMNTINMIKRNIEDIKPHLIIFTGDIITSAFTRNRAIGLAEMLEKYQIYWAPVYGNHDTEHSTALTRDELTDLWSSYSYCLIKKGDVEGDGNYIVNIKTSENTISQSLIFMDSGAYMSDIDKEQLGIDTDSYDYIKPSQIEWYKDSLTAIKNQYANDTKSMLFIHIPLPEYQDAYVDGDIIYGEKRESVCSSKYNSGMFEAIKDIGSTQAIFSGHDHINDYQALYQDVHFIYCQPSGYSTYDIVSKFDYDDEERLQGCLVITISNNQEFNITRKLNNRF